MCRCATRLRYFLYRCSHNHSSAAPIISPPLMSPTPFVQVCHAPQLLLVPLPTLARRRRLLYRALARCPAWEREWRSLNPARRADCMVATSITHLRLDFLVTSQQVRGGVWVVVQGRGCGGAGQKGT